MKTYLELIVDTLIELDVDLTRFNLIYQRRMNENIIDYSIGEDELMKTVKVKIKDIERFKK